MAQDTPQKAQEDPEMTPRGPKMRPRWPNMGQDIRSASEEGHFSKILKNLRKINEFARSGASQDVQNEAKMAS